MPKIVMFSQGMANQAMKDEKFLQSFKSFQSLRLPEPIKTPNVGCSKCKRRQQDLNIYRSFMAVVITLSPDDLQRFKQHFGVEQLLINWHDAQGRPTVKIV